MRLFAPEAREKYRELVAQGWTDALRKLHPDERIYTFWHYWRNSFERDAGIRIDHALLSPDVGEEAEGGGRRPHPARLGEDQRPCADVGRGRGLTASLRRQASPAPARLRAELVPDAGFEPATFGLQNRCSTN